MLVNVQSRPEFELFCASLQYPDIETPNFTGAVCLTDSSVDQSQTVSSVATFVKVKILMSTNPACLCRALEYAELKAAERPPLL